MTLKGYIRPVPKHFVLSNEEDLRTCKEDSVQGCLVPCHAQVVLAILLGNTHTDTSIGENMSNQSQLIGKVNKNNFPNLYGLVASFASLTAALVGGESRAGKQEEICPLLTVVKGRGWTHSLEKKKRYRLQTVTDDLAGDKRANFYIVVWSIDAEICNRIIKVDKYTYVSESTSRNSNRAVKRAVSVGGIDTRLLPRSQNISEHTGKMKGRTEDVRRECQEDKEQDLIHKLFRERDTKTQRETQISKGRLDRMKRQKITTTVNSRSTLKSERHIRKTVYFPQSREI